MPHQRPGDGYPLLLTAGEVLHRLVDLVGKAHPLQQGVRLGDALLSEKAADRREERHVRQTGVQHVLAAGGIFHQCEILIDGADGGLNGPAGPAVGRLKVNAVYQNGAAVTAERTVEDPEQGGLARTGRTDHRYKIPLTDGKAGVSQGEGAVLKFFTDMLDFQQHK